jgi:hypothetical protein
MIGSTTPFAERPDWHPVHRANAMLRAALLSSACPSPAAEDEEGLDTLSRAITSVMEGPVNITFPQPLAARLEKLPELEADFPAFDLLLDEDETFEAGSHAEENDDDRLDELAAGLPLDPERRFFAPQRHVQDLMQEFRRRQRRANMLVAGSIVTAALLTMGGLVLIASLATPRPTAGDNRPLTHSTSVAWQKPTGDTVGIRFATVSTNRAAKGEPLVIPAIDDAGAGTTPAAAHVILAASGRQIALAPLLPPSPAGYLLIRGLPANSVLSAGRQSESGTWLVKGSLLHDLTLSIGDAAEGDYPVEVYMLQSGDAPQSRRNLVLRIEAPLPPFPAAAPDWAWASTLFNVVPAAQAAEMPSAPAEARVLRDRAKHLLGEGDIAGARLLLRHLAERGEGDAAYELGRTFDRDMLTELGAKGVDADLARARGWYERASQDGNVKAAERLKILASLSGTGPSD